MVAIQSYLAYEYIEAPNILFRFKIIERTIIVATLRDLPMHFKMYYVYCETEATSSVHPNNSPIEQYIIWHHNNCLAGLLTSRNK